MMQAIDYACHRFGSGAGEGVSTATMLQPSNAAASSTVAANILKSPAIKKTIREGQHLIAVR